MAVFGVFADEAVQAHGGFVSSVQVGIQARQFTGCALNLKVKPGESSNPEFHGVA
ncbi:hypothetical protein GCM10009104_35670 [Marinobacterium maritimum]|uniref:Uncharacterized protein n=1 Tax=Marinobacterium maritimum TaxID=500162 RepID=A0ABN1IBP4_9GAMM